MRFFGCAYYPEYWGVDRVETDARLMQEAGINTVRMGEFAWSREVARMDGAGRGHAWGGSLV